MINSPMPSLSFKQLNYIDSKISHPGLWNCWEWQGHRINNRYGKVSINQKYYLAHRIVYFIETGIDPSGRCVCHRCDNPVCVNPKHLFLGSQRENVHDMMRKKRDRKNPRRGSDVINSKLTDKKVKAIRGLWSSGNYAQRELALKFKVGQTAISNIVQRKTWAHI